MHLAVGVVSERLVRFVDHETLDVLGLQGTPQEVIHHHLRCEEEDTLLTPCRGPPRGGNVSCDVIGSLEGDSLNALTASLRSAAYSQITLLLPDIVERYT